MSNKSRQGIEVFSILSKKKVVQIVSILDENIVKDPYDEKKIQELKKIGFTQRQSRNILEAFFNFYDALKYPERMREFIDQLKIDESTKQLIMDAFEMVLKKGDKSKVILTEKVENLKVFGHDHLHRLDAVAEFRPLTDGGKLQKIAVSIIIDGEIQNNAHANPKTINFQTDLTTFQTMVQDLNKQLDTIIIEINTLKEKLGDSVVES